MYAKNEFFMRVGICFGEFASWMKVGSLTRAFHVAVWL